MLRVRGIGNLKNRNTWIHARGQIPLERPLHRPCANILWLYLEWFLSVCLDYGPMGEALPPHAPANVVGFDLLDDFAVVNGIIETPGELADATAMQTHIDRLKRERDATKDKDEMRRIKVVRDHRAFTEARRQTIKRPARLDAPAGCAFRRPDGYQA